MQTIPLQDIPRFLGERPYGLARSGVVRVQCPEASVLVPFRYFQKAKSDRLIVSFNGAVDRRVKPNGIVFQRSTWADDFPASILFLSDPALLDNSLSLAWGQISRLYSFGPIAMRVARAFARVVASSKPPVIYFGTSAGGFQAASASAYDHNSVCVVNNAQFDWTKYDGQRHVDACLERLGFVERDIPEDFLSRTSIYHQLRQNRQTLNLIYLLNESSVVDVETQLPVYEKISEICASTRLVKYRDEKAGHDPLQKEPLMGWLRAVVDGTSSWNLDSASKTGFQDLMTVEVACH